MLKRLWERIFGRSCTNKQHGCRGRAVRGNYCKFCWDRALLDSFRYKTWTEN